MTRSSLFFRFLLVMLICMSIPMASSTQAQDLLRTGGPDAFGYTFTDSTEPDGPTYQWTEIVGNGGTELTITDEEGMANFTSPFPIAFYDLSTTNVRVANNGALLLGTTTGTVSWQNAQLSSTSLNYLVAPLWDDMGLTANDPGGVYWAVVGTAPNRQLIIEWHNVPIYGTSNAANPGSWQIVFGEDNPDILFYYQDVDMGGSSQGSGATVGMRGANAAQSLQYSYNESALSNNLAIRFAGPEPAVTLSPVTATQYGLPSDDVVYQLQVANFTGVSDTLTLAYDGDSWPISGPSTVGPLGNAGQATVAVTVTIPMTATIGESQVHTVTLSSSDQTYTDTAVLTTKAQYTAACSNVPVAIPTSSSTGISRQMVVSDVPVVAGVQVELDISTTAPQQLIVDLQSPDGQTVVLHNQTTNSVQGTYTATLPVDGPGTLEDFIGGSATGDWILRARNPSGFTSATLENCQLIFAPVTAGLYLVPAEDSLQIAPGSSNPYTMTLVNTTAQSEIVDFSYQSDMHMVDGPLNAVVGAGESVTISLVIDANPVAAPLQYDPIIVTASAGTVSASSTINVMVIDDTWELRTSMGTARSGPAAASDAELIYVFGGRNSSVLASMEIYDPATDTWQAGSAMPGAKHRASAVELNGTFYVLGGENAGYLTSNFAYTPGVTPANGTWVTKQPMQVAVSSMVAVADPQTDQVYVFGGRSGDFNTTSAVQVFTPDAGMGQWTRGVTMPLSLGRSVGTRLDRKVYITGGVVSTTSNTKLLIYDLDAQTWSFGPDLPQHRNFTSMAPIGDNVCVAGGAISFSPSATSWCFNTVSESWFQVASLNVGRQYLDVVAGPDGIYAIGGEMNNASTSQGTCLASGTAYCATVERYGTAPANLGASTKTVSPSVVEAGDIVTYTLTLSNTGDMQVSAMLTDTLDPALTVVELGAPLQGTDVLTAMLDVAANSSVVLTFTAQVSAEFSGVITNSFDLSGDGNVYTIMGDDLTVIPAGPAPVASFVSSSPDTLGQTTSFTNTSAGSIDMFMWNFGDGTTSALTNPTHIYTETGTFTVTLMASGPDGSDTFTGTVEIVAAGAPPVAGFTSSSPDTLGQTTSFTNTSTGDVVSFMWDFGDGATSLLENPTHTYTATGTYTVSLMVSGPDGSDTFTDTVEIVAAPTVAIEAMPNPALVGQTVEFSSTATGAGLSYVWDFGNGQTSTDMNPSFVYDQVGSYTVTLTVTDENGVEATATITVEVRAAIFLPVVRK